jgi:hypothetical protein
MGPRAGIGTVEEKKSNYGGNRTLAIQLVAIPPELSQSQNNLLDPHLGQ